MRAHTITANARAAGRGRTKRTIVPRGILALSLAVVLLAATASTASAHDRVATDFGPKSVGFGDRQVGTTSPAAALTFRVGCRPTVSGCEAGSLSPRISVSGDYAQTNNCPPTLLTGQSCTINVTFTPTSTGPKNGTLSTGREGPKATLTGNGVTTPTPPTPPLTLQWEASHFVHERPPSTKVELSATTNHDSTLVVRGDVKRTVVQLAAGETTGVGARLKHPRRLRLPGGWFSPAGERRTKIKVAATDEFGQTATDEIKTRIHARW
jgi:hypothetical protein